MMSRIGVFEVLNDNGEKYDTRKLVVRCTICATVTERRYASVTQYDRKTCIHCPRRLAKDRILAFIRKRPRTRAEVSDMLGRNRNNVIRVLREMLDDGEIIRYRSERTRQPWLYASPSVPNTTGAVGAASACSLPSASETA